MKTCTKCKEEKPLEGFYFRSDTGKYKSSCKDCHNRNALERYHTDPSVKADYRKRSTKHYLKKLYGITPELYEGLFDRQGGVCAICKHPESQNRALAVDHCHTTEDVRGLLCQACNTALGKFKDDPEIIGRALAYIIGGGFKCG